MKNKRLLALVGSVCLIFVLAALPFMAACAPAAPPEEEAPPPAEEEEAPPPPPSGPQYGGVLRIIVPTNPRVIGYMVETAGWFDKMIGLTSLEQLFRYKDDTGACMPWLATGWKEDPQAMTYTISLKQGVKFHDGSDFNAEVVKWNLDKYILSGRGELVDVKSIDIIDDYTIRLNLFKWTNLIPSHLATYTGIMHSKAAYEKHGKEWMDWNPVGTGPFKLVSAEKDVSIKYERFDDYWGDKPYLDGVEWLIIAEPLVALAAFETGEADVTINISPKNAKDLEVRGKYNIATTPAGLEMLAPDSSNPDSVFADVKVRQAFDYAIDREAIASALGYGYWAPTNQFSAPGSWGYNPDVVGHPYNPTKAKQLLAEAGYPDGFKTTIYCDPSIETWVTAVQGYLKEIGIDANVDLGTYSRTIQIFMGGWENGLVSISIGKSAIDDLALLNTYLQPDMILFRSMLKPSGLWDAVQAATAAPDRQTKQAAVYRVQEEMTDKYAIWHTLIASSKIAAKHPHVHDDGFFTLGVMQWSPEKAWLSR